MSRAGGDLVAAVSGLLPIFINGEIRLEEATHDTHFGSRGAVFQHEFAICSGHSSNIRRVRPIPLHLIMI